MMSENDRIDIDADGQGIMRAYRYVMSLKDIWLDLERQPWNCSDPKHEVVVWALQEGYLERREDDVMIWTDKIITLFNKNGAAG